MASMRPSKAVATETTGHFGSGQGRVRFFRRYDKTGEIWSSDGTRNFYRDEEIRSAVEDHFFRNKPYLRHRYMLNELVDEIGIPRHVLSASLQRLYGMGFPTIVNRYRIQFMLDNRNRPDWKNYTQEAIGAECGFSSRNSFIKSVRNFLGKYPSEVLRGTPHGSVARKVQLREEQERSLSALD